MELITQTNTEKKRFKYLGSGGEFAVIFFKNIILTFLTLGLYYPWAKTERLKYHYQSSELEKSRFSFTGTGAEIFKGFLKVYLIIIALYIFVIISIQSESGILNFIAVSLFYLFLFLITPLAIHGAIRYRASRSSWKGVHFRYIGDKMILFKKYIVGIILTLLTFGIYYSWMAVDLRKYVFSNLKFGNLSFRFKGEGSDLFIIYLKFFILVYPTLGIYSFWFHKNLLNYYAENTEITQEGKKIKFGMNIGAGDIFELTVINSILLVLTFGLAAPWVKVRTLQFMLRFLHIEEGLDTNAIIQTSHDDYEDASGDSWLDAFDFDFI